MAEVRVRLKGINSVYRENSFSISKNTVGFQRGIRWDYWKPKDIRDFKPTYSRMGLNFRISQLPLMRSGSDLRSNCEIYHDEQLLYVKRIDPVWSKLDFLWLIWPTSDCVLKGGFEPAILQKPQIVHFSN